eukprot:jgi/Tetstr1/427716/TSEL_017840.t1
MRSGHHQTTPNVPPRRWVRGSLIRFGETRAAERVEGAKAAATVSMHPARPAVRSCPVRTEQRRDGRPVQQPSMEWQEINDDVARRHVLPGLFKLA